MVSLYEYLFHYYKSDTIHLDELSFSVVMHLREKEGSFRLTEDEVS